MEGQIIIIKKVKRGGHSGAHGGSWKVAYADFVTAMMAFFLLMWLISMVAPEKRARVAHYFKHFSMFDKSGDSMIDGRKDPVAGLMLGDDGMQKSSEGSGGEGEGASDGQTSAEHFKEMLEQKVEQELGEIKDQVLVKAFDGGVRIELVDSESRPMFHLGRSEVTPEGKKALKVVGETLLTSGSKVALEGHTDAFSYSTRRYSNWELSTERASAARKELELDGLPPERLLRVAGFAATEPLIKDDPFDPRNRRISIVVFEPQPLVLNMAAEPLVQPIPKPVPVEEPKSQLSILEDPRFRSPAHQQAAVDQPSSAMVRSEPRRQLTDNQAMGEVRKKIPMDPVHQYLLGQ